MAVEFAFKALHSSAVDENRYILKIRTKKGFDCYYNLLPVHTFSGQSFERE
jgi:hypothetical protein